MSKGYVIVTEDVIDADGMAGYSAKAGATLTQYGGKPIVAADQPEVVEGQWHGPRTIIIEFESVDAARAWYHSPEYQSIVGLRHAAANSNAVIVQGFALPG